MHGTMLRPLKLTTLLPGLPILRYTWRHSRTLAATIFCHRDGKKTGAGYVPLREPLFNGISYHINKAWVVSPTTKQLLEHQSSRFKKHIFSSKFDYIFLLIYSHQYGIFISTGPPRKKSSIPVAIDGNPGNLR